ncbi:leucine-rich repeat-containing protein let-4-like [Diorhabda carinulata]|uniref:leucine-rich repeat-containing protein let-4-like n=1 Tax=Diorhabda carinulata TaxID=1163345 RepID=UPI0025A096EC|nr:leucine-rich repeat-containing protein let-4-like [Diorhabda carinulata]
MLILIITVIMCCVKTNSVCLDFCDCSKVLSNKKLVSNQFDFNESQQSLHSLVSVENGSNSVSFPDSSTVILQICEMNFEFGNLNLEWIKHLVLTENNFTTVPEFISAFKSVDMVDLSRNKIKYLEESSFTTLNLTLLNISKNFITSLSNISYGLNTLINLDISYNNVENIDYVIDFPNLQYLNLSANNMKVLNADFLNNLILLQHLDVSRNKLTSIAPIQLQNLINLLIGDNDYLGKTRDIFYVGNGRKIQTLDASRIGLQQVPAILTHSIKYLILKKNLIRSINSGDLDSYPLLNTLDLSSNNIKFIEEDSLGRLEFLSVLYLTNNQLEEIPRSLPEKLKVLHLDINKIGVIRKKDLQGLSELRVLFLNDNNVSVINEGVFSELTSLVSLDLSRNPIIDLETGIFAGPPSLEVLHLASVNILPTDNTSFPFSTPESLVKLNLSSSPGLVHQFLMDTATLMAAKRLQELDLTGGNLKFIRQDLQFFLPQLKSLHINGNELSPSQINWLKSWLCAQNQNDEVDNSTHIEFLNISTSTSSAIKSKQFKSEARSFTDLDVNGNKLTNRNINDVGFNVNEGYQITSKFSQALFSPYNKYSASNHDENEIMKVVPLKLNTSSSEFSVYENGKTYFYIRLIFYVVLTVVTVYYLFALYQYFIRIEIQDTEVTNLSTISDIW